MKSAELRIVTAYDPIPPYLGEPNLQVAIDTRLIEAQEILKRAVELVGDSNVDVHTELIEGNPAEAIIEVAQTRNSDVIVMGSRGLGRVAGLLLGSTSQKVVSHAPWRAGEAVDLVVSRASRLTLLDETGVAFRDAHWHEDLRSWLSRGADGDPGRFAEDLPGLDDVRLWPAGDLAAGPSSGSYPVKGMLIVPASTACVAGVALGLSKDLLQRAASVTLKERRP